MLAMIQQPRLRLTTVQNSPRKPRTPKLTSEQQAKVNQILATNQKFSYSACIVDNCFLCNENHDNYLDYEGTPIKHKIIKKDGKLFLECEYQPCYYLENMTFEL